MFTIDAGQFKHKITVLRAMIIKDDDNIPVQKEVELFTTKAKITNVRGDETKLAQGIYYKQEKRVHLRVNRKHPINQKDIILFNGQKYNITYLNNIEEANRYYEIKMELVE